MELTVGTQKPPEEQTSNKGSSGFMKGQRFNCIKTDKMSMGWREAEEEISEERNNTRAEQETAYV